VFEQTRNRHPPIATITPSEARTISIAYTHALAEPSTESFSNEWFTIAVAAYRITVIPPGSFYDILPPDLTHADSKLYLIYILRSFTTATNLEIIKT
jgi:hypothetical protein